VGIDNKVVFIYLTPCVPLSYQGEGEKIERGADAPLRLPKSKLGLEYVHFKT